MSAHHADHQPDARARWVEEQLASLDRDDSTAVHVGAAWERWQARHALRSAPRPRRHRLAWAGSAACLALIGALGFSSAARSATARVLALFRITQVTALPLDINGSAPLADRTTAGMIQQLVSDSLTVTRNDPNQLAATAGAATGLVGFAVRVPGGIGARYQVRGEKDFQMVVDRNRAQAILDSAGLVGVDLPPSLDGSTISVHLPAAVTVMMGDCSTWQAQPQNGFPSPPANGACTVLGESPSPAVNLPPGLDMQKIAEVGLQLLGMSAEEAQQYCQTIDWTSTLVVPFPRSQAQSQTVSVDGVQGILLTRTPPNGQPFYVLLWSRGGMLYSIAGPGAGSQGLALAAQLPPA